MNAPTTAVNKKLHTQESINGILIIFAPNVKLFNFFYECESHRAMSDEFIFDQLLATSIAFCLREKNLTMPGWMDGWMDDSTS